MEAVDTDTHSSPKGEPDEPIVQNEETAETEKIHIEMDILQNNIDPPVVPKYQLSQLSQLPDFEELKHRIIEYFRSKINDQDTIQKITVLLTVCMEFYRILMGSLLLSFVPQKCGDHVCGITENLYSNGAYYVIYILNLMTLISFSLLYLVEIKRENRLITYLDVNNSKPTDAVSVAIHLRALPDIKRENILYIDKIYQQIGCCAIAVYVFNTVLSTVVIYANYLDNKTITAFLTNVLFMGCKVNEVYSIANTENNIFFSAYLKNKVQYNDVDNDKISTSEIGQSIENIEGSQDEY
jgi:hypothetical protein